MRKILLLLIVSSISITGFSQDQSNKGKDFWLAYPAHNAGTASRMALYLTSDVNTSGTVQFNGNTIPFTITANQTTVVRIGNATIPSNASCYISSNNLIEVNKGIHITALKSIVAYAHILNAAVSGSTLLLPKTVLGREYVVSTYVPQGSTAGVEKCQFVVVGVENNTTVEITPVNADISGTHPAGTPFQITLNEGDAYQFQSFNELSGSKVVSVSSNSNSCQKIVVFGSTTRSAIGCNNASSGDNLFQQLTPVPSWGKDYITVPFISKSYYIVRVYVSNPVVPVIVNGAALPLGNLISNSYYEFNANTPQQISSTDGIAVYQYIVTQNCDGVQSDPEMILVNSTEQTLNDLTFISAERSLTPPNTNITSHFVNIILKNTGTALSSLRLDGVSPAVNFNPIGVTNYVYAQINLSATTSAANPSHRIYSDSGFIAIAYGYGNVESYGYNAGTNVKDLYQQIGVSTEYGIETTPSVCSGSPFKFRVSLPYCADSLRWDLTALPGPPVPSIYTVKYPICGAGSGGADSTTVVNGKILYWYSLPGTYSFSTVGVYPVNITAYRTGASACGNEQDIDFDLQVSAPPGTDFTWVAPGCPVEPVSFIDITNSVKPTYKWWWDFGDPASGANNTSPLKNPVHTFSAPGTYEVRYANITTPGCLSDTIPHPVVVPKFPIATISGATTVCINYPIQPSILFTATEGKAPYTFTYNIDAGAGPGPNLTVSSSGTNNTVSILAPTNAAGTFTYKLINVSNVGFAACNQNITGQQTVVTIRPDATVNLTSAAGTDNQTVCINTAAVNITYAIGGSGTGGSVTGLPAGVTGTFAGNVITITGTPSVSGIFNYTVTTTGPCVKPSAAGTITVTADATIALLSAPATANQSLCLNTTITNITYGVGGTGTGGNVTGLPAGVTGMYAAGVITISGTPSASGIFNYTVNTAGPCAKPTAVGTITVYALPTLNFTGTAPSCETRLITFTDNTNPNVGTLTNWDWNFGDVNSTVANPNTSTEPNPKHTFSTVGNYTVGLTVITSNGCTNPAPFTKIITINDRPKAGFIVPEVCINDVSAIFTDTSKIAVGAFNAAGYEWDFGDPASGAANTATTKDGTHLYTLTGSYPVRHIVTSVLGCKDTTFNNIFINGADPLADFYVTNATTLCANDSVGIVNLSTILQGSITKVEIYWDFVGAPTIVDTDDFPFPNKVYKHKYLNFQSPLTKDYTIRFRAYSGTLCQDVIAKPITVNAAPKVQFDAVPDACLDAMPFQITQASEVGGVPGSFVYSGSGVNAAGVFNPALAGVGTHTIKYTFTSSAAGCIDVISRSIKVLDTATAKFSFASPVCEDIAATFTEESIAPTGVTLNNTLWNFGDGSPAEPHVPGSTFTHNFPGWGPYTVTMYNTSADGCRSTSKFEQVYISPIPLPAFVPNETSVCLPDASVSFKNNSTMPDNTMLTYLWDFGDGSTTSTALAPIHIYPGVGPYTVKLTATSNSNCKKTIPLAVDFIHPQPKAAFDFSEPEVCIGREVTFNDLTDGLDGTVVKWNWDFGDVTTGKTKQAPHLYATAKTYNVSLYIINSQGCKSTTATKPFRVNPYPVVDAGGDKAVLEGGTITLQPNVTGNDLTYLWSPATYINSVTSPTPIASNMLDDITYTLTVKGRGGCAAAPVTIFVKVLKAPRIPNTFTPNGDGRHELWVIEYLDTYPNCKVQVFTRAGQLVFESRGYKKPWNGTVNGKTLPIDTYYYIIEPENGRKPITGYVTILK
jgi:gliding motility-associated-like protein